MYAPFHDWATDCRPLVIVEPCDFTSFSAAEAWIDAGEEVLSNLYVLKQRCFGAVHVLLCTKEHRLVYDALLCESGGLVVIGAFSGSPFMCSTAQKNSIFSVSSAL